MTKLQDQSWQQLQHLLSAWNPRPYRAHTKVAAADARSRT